MNVKDPFKFRSLHIVKKKIFLVGKMMLKFDRKNH